MAIATKKQPARVEVWIVRWRPNRKSVKKTQRVFKTESAARALFDIRAAHDLPCELVRQSCNFGIVGEHQLEESNWNAPADDSRLKTFDGIMAKAGDVVYRWKNGELIELTVRSEGGHAHVWNRDNKYDPVFWERKAAIRWRIEQLTKQRDKLNTTLAELATMLDVENEQ